MLLVRQSREVVMWKRDLQEMLVTRVEIDHVDSSTAVTTVAETTRSPPSTNRRRVTASWKQQSDYPDRYIKEHIVVADTLPTGEHKPLLAPRLQRG